MAKKRQYNYSKTEEYMYLLTGTITKIIELNKEYEKHFKTVFSIKIPTLDDKRFETCISWSRWIIQEGDLIIMKGRFLEHAFLVKSLRILRKAESQNANIQNST